MNIGILTYHAACNFGANLQALSTIMFLKKNGHNPILINWYPEELDNVYLKSCPEVQYEEHLQFRNIFFNMTNRCYTCEDVAKAIDDNNIEAIIVGSDAVVQHHPLLSRIVFPSRRVISFNKVTKDRLFPNPFWCCFCDSLDYKIPIAYMSVSSQNSPFSLFSNSMKEQMKYSLKNIGYCSTRDDWTAKMLETISDGTLRPVITPDPVFAFNQNVEGYITKKELIEKYNLPENYYLISFHDSKTVSKEWLHQFNVIAKENGVECVAFPFPDGIRYEHPFEREINLPLSPLDWYYLLKYSCGYIGHNMHPIVVCLHNAVPCFSFDNYGIVKFRLFVNNQSSKIYHIMKQFDVLNNHVKALGLCRRIPSPQFVHNRIISFDKSSVSQKGQEYISSYNAMMKDILSYFYSFETT